MVVTMSPQMEEALDTLASTGFYGKTGQDAARRLLERAIIEALADMGETDDEDA